jgi:hypothetical protein
MFPKAFFFKLRLDAYNLVTDVINFYDYLSFRNNLEGRKGERLGDIETWTVKIIKIPGA